MCDWLLTNSSPQVETDKYFNFFLPALKNQGYEGCFCPKSRSKTLPEEERKHVDGCAIFFNRNKYVCLFVCLFVCLLVRSSSIEASMFVCLFVCLFVCAIFFNRNKYVCLFVLSSSL